MPTDLGYRTVVRIGSTVGTMEDVKIEPIIEYQPGETERTVSGHTTAVGSPRLIWSYPDRRLTGPQFYQLKNLVGDKMSATVYVDVPVNNLSTSTYGPLVATYQGILQWPSEGVKRIMYNEWELPDIIITNLVAV